VVVGTNARQIILKFNRVLRTSSFAIVKLLMHQVRFVDYSLVSQNSNITFLVGLLLFYH